MVAGRITQRDERRLDTSVVANCGIIHQSRSKVFFSASFVAHNSLFVLIFDATLPELMRASLNDK